MATSRASQLAAADDGPPGELTAHWRVVAAAFTGLVASNFYLYSLGVLIAPLQHEFGWSRSSITFATLITGVTGMLAYPAVGAAVDRFGSRRIAIPGLVVFGLTLAGLAFCGPKVWSWWAGIVVVAAAQTSCGVGVWSAALTLCFDKRRGLALGLALSGSGIAGVFVPSLTNGLIEAFGWRFAVVSLGALSWLIALPPVWLWFKPPSPAPNRKALRGRTFRSAIVTITFWQLALAALLLSATVGGLLVHFVPLLESVGLSRKTGTAIAGLIGVASIVGRIASGTALDSYKVRYVGAFSFGLPIVTAALFLMDPSSLFAVCAAAVALGLTFGAESDIVAYATGRYFSRDNYSILYALFIVVVGIGFGLGPLLGSAIFDRTGNYRLFCVAVAAMSACGAFLILTLRSPRTPLSETQMQGESS